MIQAERIERETETIDVSIVMPCLNEEATIGLCIEAASNALDMLGRVHGLSGEIVVADNGSTDRSREIAESLGARVVAVADKGYGNALRGGIDAARGRYVVMGDADCSYDFGESVPMVERLVEGHDLCMGSRFKGEIRRGAMPWKNRYIGNPVLTGILNLFFRSKLSDAHCGMRAFSKDAFARLGLTSEGMEFASEMVIKASLLDIRRTEVPVTLHPDRRTRPPHLRPWRDGWRHLRYLLMLSPAWVFFVPGAFFGTIGALIFALYAIFPADPVVNLGPIRFGVHWVVIAGGMLTSAHQLFISGLATTIYGIREGYRQPGTRLRTVLKLVRLEYMLLLGLVLLLVGFIAGVDVVSEWVAADFGALNKAGELIIGTTLSVLGLQNLFGGFLLAVISGNQAEHILER